jgi:hypothetical protein
MNDMNDRLEKLACMKRLHDALSEAIAALESGRDADVEYRYPEHAWHRYPWLDSVEHRCTIKPREVWVNEYVGGLAGAFDSRRDADEHATPHRIRCTRFVEAPNDEP